MSNFKKVFWVLMIGLLLGPWAHAMGGRKKECSDLATESPIVFDIKTREFKGLTASGLKRVKEQRDRYRARNTLFEARFFNMSTHHFVLDWARLGKGRVLLAGGFGAAKSEMAKWHASAESEAPFELLMNPMTPESALVGGQTRAAAENGIFHINTQGSAGAHKVVILDELHLANPQTLGAALSILERPSVYRHGAVRGQTKIETVIATANANLAEIVASFREGAQRASAGALLNRFQVKGYVHNRIDDDGFHKLRDWASEKARLEAAAKYYPELLNDQAFLTPEFMDWDLLRDLAPLVFEISEDAKSVFRDFAVLYDKSTIKAKKDSQLAHQQNPTAEPEVYTPTGELATRLELQLYPMILETALLDLLSSPLVDDGNIENLFKKPIVLGPLSIWRASYFLTTVGPGRARLAYTPSDPDRKIGVNFGWNLEPSKGSDAREEHMIKGYLEEQMRFNTCLADRINNLQFLIDFTSQFQPGGRSIPIEQWDFEMRLLQSRGEIPNSRR